MVFVTGELDVLESLGAYTQLCVSADEGHSLYVTDEVPELAPDPVVDETLHYLLCAAMGYPPALAALRLEMRERYFRVRDEFLCAVEESLRRNLSLQGYYKFPLAQMKCGKRMFHWIVAADAESVWYVDDCYFTFRADRGDFSSFEMHRQLPIQKRSEENTPYDLFAGAEAPARFPQLRYVTGEVWDAEVVAMIPK